MDNPFDTELNVTAHENTLDATTMAVSDVIGGGLVATTVDIGASLWNSLPFTEEVDTADLLSRISGNALQVYQEHPDAIHTASFVGGMLLPIGATSKAMGLLRSGAKGASWFGNAERAADLKKIGEAVEATKSYRDITYGIYAKTAVNQAIDAVAAELAIVGTLNAHPFMEDYMKDFGSNFTLSAMLGASLGAGIGVIADRFAIRAAAGEVTQKAFGQIADNLSPAFHDMTNSLKLQANETSIKNLAELINQRKAAGKTSTDDLTYAMAEEFSLKLKAQQASLFESMISEDIKKLPKEQKDTFMRLVIDKPEMLGVENITLLTEKEVTSKGLVKAPTFSLSQEPSFTSTTSVKGPTKPKAQEAVFFPELGLYGTKKDAIHYADASVFGQTKEQMAKNLPYNYGRVPNYDTPLELLGKSSASIQKEYIAAWEYVKNLSPKQFQGLHIGEGDAALINAALWRMVTDPEVAGVTVKMSNNLPVMKQIVKEHVEKLVQEGKITAQEAANAGPDAIYAARLDKLGDAITKNAYNPALAGDLIQDWIGGNKQRFNQLAADHIASQHGGFAASGVKAENVREFDRIYNSPESKRLRAEFQQLADSEGYVYLYRGMKTNSPVGSQMLDSFTTHYQKAAQFVGTNRERGVKLYKVPVDDIVAGFKDVGPGVHNAEIIVRASARVPVAELSATGKMALKKQAEQVSISNGTLVTTKTTLVKETIEEGTKQVGPEELAQMFVAGKQEAIDSLLANGMPLESIALKTNTDLSVVKAYSLSKQVVGLDNFIPPNTSPLTALNKIKRYDDIDSALSPEKQPIVLASNQLKNPLYIQRGVALDAKDTRMVNKEFSALSMLSSRSEAAKSMGNLFYHPEGMGNAVDIVLARIGAINNETAGSAFFNSADAFARNMKDVGPAISAIGKEVQKIAQNTIARVIKPIEDAMVGIQKDPGALVEFATFYNVNASLKGWRGFDKEGYLVQKAIETGTDGKKVEVLKRVKYATVAGEAEYRVVTPSVKTLIDAMQSQSTELRELSNTINRLKGTPDISDIGLWMPSFNPVDKHIAYVHDSVEQTTKLIWARTSQEYEAQIKALKKNIAEAGNDKRYQIVTKDQQADWNLLNGRLDPIHMERADVSLQKGGASAAAIVKPDLSLFGEIAKGYEFYITSQVRNLADLNLYEVTDTLSKMSAYNRRLYEGQPFSGLKAIVSKPKDSAAIMKNILLGSSNLGEYGGWQTANRTFEVGVSMGVNFVSDLFNKTVKPLLKFGKEDGSIEIAGKKKIDYKTFNEELEKRNIQYPWKALDEAKAKEMGFFNIEQSSDTFKRLIYGGNALAATMALRFGEIAQPLVNAMSMPILTGLAIAQKMPESFLGVQKATVAAHPTQIMMEGLRAMHSPQFAALNKKWEEKGLFQAMVSEVTDVMRATRRFDKGATAAIENALDSSFIKVMSKPADLTESLTRKVAMNTGAVLAKRLYPELDDAGITIFARDFMDKSIGNFHAAQRPVMFQGTLGVALGLFQTYMWTLGQSVYRHLEHKQYAAIGKAALLQSSLFGAQSLPGFEAVSHAIANHYSDDNVDLTTGTYRALPDKLADFVLYGLPSNLPIGASFSTRGDISPRLPVSPEQMVSVNFITQAAKNMMQIASAVDTQSQDVPRAFAQALSLQSMSRPIARTAELATGYSITGRGNTVQTPEEVWTFQGVASRVLSTRPMSEQKLRDADHLNHLYGAMDRDNREKAMKKLRTALRNGTLNDTIMSETAEEYFRHGGSPAGWRSAVNLTIARTEESGRETLMDRLKPNNPINYMIDSLER